MAECGVDLQAGPGLEDVQEALAVAVFQAEVGLVLVVYFALAYWCARPAPSRALWGLEALSRGSWGAASILRSRGGGQESNGGVP